MSTVSMHNPETGKTADVHADEVSNWKKHGWRESDVAPPPPSVPPPPVPPVVKRETLTIPRKGV